jgi:deazaflavin-dependent oxidoreductase (nitroreductase family)
MRARCLAWTGTYAGASTLALAPRSGKRAVASDNAPPAGAHVPQSSSLETQIYRRVNSVLEPAIRAGLGAPLLSPAGLVVVEMLGAKTGKPRRVPLAALRFGNYLMIGTVRGERSLWVRNLAANGAVRVWLAARAKPMRAFVLRPGASTATPRALPLALRAAWRALAALTASGFAFALLAPAPERGALKRAASPRAPASRRATRARSR